jgi:hypothetical protein
MGFISFSPTNGPTDGFGDSRQQRERCTSLRSAASYKRILWPYRRQWIQTRTANFKHWFGDHEKLAQKLFLESKPVVGLTGKEFQKSDKKITETVPKWFAEIGGKAVNPVLGDVALNGLAKKRPQRLPLFLALLKKVC